MSVVITGAKQHSDRLKRMASPQVDALTVRALYVAGQAIEIEAEISITSGSISGKEHIPSLPGEPPKADTRDLDTHIETSVVSTSPPQVNVEATSAHAVPLEWGTSKMAERPFMRPATAKKKGEALALVTRAVNQTMK